MPGPVTVPREGAAVKVTGHHHSNGAVYSKEGTDNRLLSLKQVEKMGQFKL